MQVSIETTSAIERRLTIGIPAAEIDQAVNGKLKDIAKRVRIDGFRQGKAPLTVVKQRYGGSVRQEVLGDVINDAYFKAIKQENIQAAGYPEIEPKQLQEGKDFEFVATLEVYPEVSLADFAQISVEKPVTEVQAGDVDDTVRMLQEQAASFEDVERAAALKDKVTIDFKGLRDGEEFPGGTAENSELELGSGRMIPGFEDGIVGMQAGEEKTLALTFPDDYQAEELQGVAVEFQVVVKNVQAKLIPALDDVFFERFDVTEGGEEAFRAKVLENMQRNVKQRQKDEIKRQVMDGLLALHDIPLPKALVSNEIDGLRQQAVQRFGGMNNQDIDFKSMLPDELFREEAQRRVQLGLIVAAITSQYELRVDEAQVDALVEEMAANYDDPQQFREYYSQDQQARSGLRSLVMEDMVVAKVLESAVQSDNSKSYQELMNPAPTTADPA